MVGNLNKVHIDIVGNKGHYFRYITVKGFFLQDEVDTDDSTFDPFTTNFGLIDQEFDTDARLPNNGKGLTQWQRFAYKVKVLNEEAAEGQAFKLLYLGRHGQGYHNVASAYYGTNFWQCYYAPLDGDPQDSSIVWADANLTRVGIYQAQQINKFWADLISKQNIPTPESFYVSPLTRACQTAELTFRSLDLPPTAAPFIPIVKEFTRERMGINTCDRRSTRNYIAKRYPYYKFESSFTENDELWGPKYREALDSIDLRVHLFFDEIFTHSEEPTYISLTSHGGTIASILRLSSHRIFYLGAGAIIPVLLKVEKVSGKRPKEISQPGDPKPDCKGDPLEAGLDGYDSLADYLRHVEKGYHVTV
ncbi:phosphoglycerate mutase family protein [Bisporella sp. PMI_857]|nr:phosphoglycerate mutase family protein [Bisporella sp. PMI_857]